MCGGGSSSLQQAPRQQQPFTQITGIENPRPKRMRIATMATFAVLSIQFCMLAQASGKLAGKGQVAEKDPAGAVGTRKSLHPSQEGDREPEVRREPSPWLQKAAEEAGAGGRAHSKAASKPRLGNIQQKASGKKKIPQRPPPKSKSQGLQSHLKGYGKFNTDTYSCPGIQFKACKKPSDCDGCLGLYTCKLPRGKCDLKAVSHETGYLDVQQPRPAPCGFFQSIQNR